MSNRRFPDNPQIHSDRTPIPPHSYCFPSAAVKQAQGLSERRFGDSDFCKLERDIAAEANSTQITISGATTSAYPPHSRHSGQGWVCPKVVQPGHSASSTAFMTSPLVWPGAIPLGLRSEPPWRGRTGGGMGQNQSEGSMAETSASTGSQGPLDQIKGAVNSNPIINPFFSIR